MRQEKTQATSQAEQSAITLDPLRTQLQEKLLSLGGTEVIWAGPEPYAARLLEQGEVFTQQTRLRLGHPNQCHRNAADLG